MRIHLELLPHKSHMCLAHELYCTWTTYWDIVPNLHSSPQKTFCLMKFSFVLQNVSQVVHCLIIFWMQPGKQIWETEFIPQPLTADVTYPNMIPKVFKSWERLVFVVPFLKHHTTMVQRKQRVQHSNHSTTVHRKPRDKSFTHSRLQNWQERLALSSSCFKP